MFYPVDSLRRGGRFYLLWVADSWPHQLAAMSNRQLSTLDVRKLCEELYEVMRSESGRPTQRYSLRLSSQLLRGLSRLYHKKVLLLLSEMCMIHANVIKHSNKKSSSPEKSPRAGKRARGAALARPRDEPEDEQRLEEILQNSANVVAHVEDITLKEAAIPEIVVMPNDGFGEETAAQALQFVVDRRSVEQMLAGADAAHASALGPALGDRSHDRTREDARALHAERASAHDLTALRPSDGGMLSVTDIGKEISEIPDIPIPPIPELPDLQEKLAETRELAEQAEAAPEVPETTRKHESTQIELEELEEVEPRAKRRRRLIIDKKTKISSDVIRARIANPRVDTHCEEDPELASLRVPAHVLLSRPAHAGGRRAPGAALSRMFLRNLGGHERGSRLLEEEEMRRNSPRPRLELAQVPEVPLPAPDAPMQAPEISAMEELPPGEQASVVDQDVSEMLTQKLQTLSPKRPSDQLFSIFNDTPAAKRLKPSAPGDPRETTGGEDELGMESYKENVPHNQQALTRRVTRRSAGRALEALTEIPQEVIPQELMPQDQCQSMSQELMPPPQDSSNQAAKPQVFSSDSSETPLGSLDRTKVSLGDSQSTTSSSMFIRSEWGVEGSMMKIIKAVRSRRAGERLTVEGLVARGPLLPRHAHIITAKCFASVLKLKQHQMISITKCPETLRILDITLGESFHTGRCN